MLIQHRLIAILRLSALSLVLLVLGCEDRADRLPADNAPAPVVESPGSGPSPDSVDRSDAVPETVKETDESSARPWFEEVADLVGIDFVHDSGQRGEELYLPEITGGGVALFDMNNNGSLDAYLVQAGRIVDVPEHRPPNRLYENQGDGTFIDVTEGSGAGDRGYGMGAAVGDYNRNGFLDLYVTNVGRNTLLRNNGDGTFTDVTEDASVGHAEWSTAASFIDRLNRGELDLFVVNYLYWSVETERECLTNSGERDYCAPTGYRAPTPDVLYHNNGDGTFTDVSAETGIADSLGNGLGIVCADFDRDGWVDIFVANDGNPDHFWRNSGDGTFIEEGFTRGCAIDQDGLAKAGMGVAVTDLDEDGFPDLLVVNLTGETDSFFRNMGDYFIDDTSLVGLRRISRGYTRWGVAFHDFNNDGRLELFQANGRVFIDTPIDPDDPYAEPNILFHQDDRGRFVELKPRGGTDPMLVYSSRGAAFGDINNNGRLDILIVNRDAPVSLLRNQTDSGHWFMARVVDDSGRDACHARVKVEFGGRTITREVRTAYSYLAANDPRVHVGLGEVNRVDAVTVRWIDGTKERFGPFDADRIVTLEYGVGRPVE